MFSFPCFQPLQQVFESFALHSISRGERMGKIVNRSYENFDDYLLQLIAVDMVWEKMKT